MSVHEHRRADGRAGWIVRWREDGRQRSRTFDDEEEAHAFERRLAEARQETRRRARQAELDAIVARAGQEDAA